MPISTLVYSMRIWTYKNADEKAHTFSWKTKNSKKRNNTDEKRILRKFILREQFQTTGSLNLETGSREPDEQRRRM